uniref:(northern house mosquito) hypothetical protein n=2 Tax=Culex pipiens TaxID=7175 RepID=A0A8D8GBS6_CULPI
MLRAFCPFDHKKKTHRFRSESAFRWPAAPLLRTSARGVTAATFFDATGTTLPVFSFTPPTFHRASRKKFRSISAAGTIVPIIEMRARRTPTELVMVHGLPATLPLIRKRRLMASSASQSGTSGSWAHFGFASFCCCCSRSRSCSCSHIHSSSRNCHAFSSSESIPSGIISGGISFFRCCFLYISISTRANSRSISSSNSESSSASVLKPT